MHDHYKVLGVARDATAAEIKSAYRQIAKVVHPDASGEANGLFSLITDAYDVLGDARKRREYDAKLVRAEYGPAGYPAPGAGSPGPSPQSREEPDEEAEEESADGTEPKHLWRDGTLNEMCLVFFGSLVAVLAAIALLTSKVYDRVVPWVGDGDRYLGYEYERSAQEMPGVIGWIGLTLVIAIPIAVAMLYTYFWKETRSKYLSPLDAFVPPLVSFFGVALHPTLLNPTGYKGILGYWLLFAALWLYAPRFVRWAWSRRPAQDRGAVTEA